MAEATSTASAKKPTVTSIAIRMYRGGTGDFFLLKFLAGKKVTFKMMIDCGCIQGSHDTFEPLIEDLQKETGNEIDLLVVTHEHADHINGFDIMAGSFSQINFKKVWFAWTEDVADTLANEYRKKYTKMKLALANAVTKFNALQASGHYKDLYRNELHSKSLVEAQDHFIKSVNELNGLNLLPAADNGKVPTMVDILTNNKVIKEAEVEFLSPGELREHIPGAPGIRIFVLGPPRELNYLSLEEKSGETYGKRESASTIEMAFVNALADTTANGKVSSPFDSEYELPADYPSGVRDAYKDKEQQWRIIDHDWLSSAGSLALKLQQSINNTSLALAIQFEGNEHVLLFPGDAEFGDWQSWHDKLEWKVTTNGKKHTANIDYLLNNTVFYKVSHHLSQNGTASIL